MTIRVATLDDAEAVAAIYAPYVRETTISFERVPPDAGEMRERMRHTLARHPWFVCEESGRLLGFAYGAPHRARDAYQWSADVSVYVAQGAYRRGIGRSLYGELLAALARQGLVQAFAGIALPNERSVGLHESLGFTPVGIYRNVGFKLGRWCDVGWWSRQLAPLPAVPTPPVPWPDLQG